MNAALAAPSASGENNPTPGWGLPVEPVICPNCHAGFVVAGNQIHVCPVCFSQKLEPQTDPHLDETPELVIPYSADRAAVLHKLHAWMQNIWIHPADLAANNLASRMVPTYFPMWLVDGNVTGSWKTQAGYEYQVASTTEGYSQGQWSTTQVTEKRLRWEPRAGTLERAYSNVAVPAMENDQRLRSSLGSFSINAAVPVTVQALQNVLVRRPDVPVSKAWSLAKIQLDGCASRDCQSASAAQQLDQFTIDANYKELNWTLLLLPLYTTYYHDDEGKLHTVYINGATGQVAGLRMASQKSAWRWTAVLAVIGVICILAAALFSLIMAVFPPIAVLNGLLIIIGIVLLLASPGPAIWAWQYNRSSGASSTAQQ